MDKDLLRLVIIAIGGIVIFGLVLWSVFKNKRSRRDINFYDEGNPLNNIDDSLIIDTSNDDFDIVPLGSAIDEELAPDPITMASEIESQPVPEDNQFKVPNIIQFSLLASGDEGFNGKELVDALQLVGLEYGSMKIFERLDDQRRVDFAVASIVEPGTFPETELESFYTPGLVFFIQPTELEDPMPIFDDLVQTIHLLATGLGGEMRDHNRQPLTDETIKQFREALA